MRFMYALATPSSYLTHQRCRPLVQKRYTPNAVTCCKCGKYPSYDSVRYRITVIMLPRTPQTCRACGLVDGPATQAIIAIVEDRDLALSNGFVRFVKCNLHGVAGPALAHRNGHCRHAIADLYARPKALVQKCGGRRRIAPYPREVVRGDSRGEQGRVAASTNKDQRQNGRRKD